MKTCLLILALALAPWLAQAQVCFEGNDNTGCPRVIQDISTSTIRTQPGATMVGGSITTSIPKVPNSMVYKDASGVIQTASNTTVSNAGSSNEGLVSVNISALNALTIPTAAAGVTPTAGDLVKTSTGALCMCINGVFKNLSSINVIVSGLLTPAIASPTNCVF